jgi:hypothetical protein
MSISNSLENLCLNSLVSTIKSTPETIQRKIIDTTKTQILEETYEKMHYEITTFLPELILNILSILKKNNNYTLKQISILDDFSVIDHYLLELAYDTAIQLL